VPANLGRVRWTILFAFLAAALAALAFATDSLLLRVPLLWAALDGAWLAVAYGGVGPRALGKRATGSLPAWALVPLAPYVIANHLALHAVRLSKESAKFAEIAPGLYLGPWPSRSDRAALEAVGVRAVLDLTCEFGASEFVTRLDGYRVLRLLDATSPSPAQIADCVAWCRGQMRRGSVYVHCAAGKGRSATVVAALVIDLGLARDPESAVAYVRARRRSIRLNAAQRAALDAWAKHRGVSATAPSSSSTTRRSP